MRVVEAEGEHERYRWTREGLRYAIRAGNGTRVLFRVWRERSAIILCTELLCAYNDGYFVKDRKLERALREIAEPGSMGVTDIANSALRQSETGAPK
jgi:hypothetical protein